VEMEPEMEESTLDRRGPRVLAAAMPGLARLAHAGVLAHAFFLSISLPGVQIGLGVALGALVLATAAGARPWRRTGLEVPLLVAAAAAVISIAIAVGTGMPIADLEAATRWKPLLAPLVVVAALHLPVPGDGRDAPRRRALGAAVAWAAGAAVAGVFGLSQATVGVDLLHVFGYHRVPLLEDVPFWPGHYAATGFFLAYPQYAHALASAAAMAGALALGARVPPRRRIALGVSAALVALALASTVSRAAWGSLVVIALVLASLAGAARLRRVAVPAFAAAVLAVTLLHPGLRIRLGNTLERDVNHNRLLFVDVCTAMWRDHPLGFGWGTFERAADPYFEAVFPGYPIRTGCHMVPLTLLVEGGALLVAAWVAAGAILVWTLVRWWRAADATGRAAAGGALAAVAGFTVNGLFHDVHLESHALWPLAFALALAATIARDGSTVPAP
jgi:O-antigen ligase